MLSMNHFEETAIAGHQIAERCYDRPELLDTFCYSIILIDYFIGFLQYFRWQIKKEMR
jgi:hypothetical protein